MDANVEKRGQKKERKRESLGRHRERTDENVS